METLMCKVDPQFGGTATPKEATKDAAKGTHLYRICNKEHLVAGYSPEGTPFKDCHDMRPDVEVLPEGWVRHGKGLMLDVPISPKMKGGVCRLQEPHFKFTSDAFPQPVKQLHKDLVKVDRDAGRRMRSEQNVKIKAARPRSDCRTGHTTCTTKPSTSARSGVNFDREEGLCNDPLNRKIAALKREHDRELLQTKQQVLEQVDGLIKKYRQLAIDAVRVAREEQKKAETERWSAYDACARYESDLKENVRNAIAHLKQSAQDEKERLEAERDALQKKCAYLTPLSAATFRPTLEHVTGEISSQFKSNANFSIDMIDESHAKINEEFEAFKESMVQQMIQRFSDKGCALQKEDATIFVECSLLTGSMFS